MDEEKITIDEKKEQSLTREEILQRSRKENAKQVDERESKLLDKGSFVACIVGLAFLVTAFFVNYFVYHIRCHEIIAAIMCIFGIDRVWQSKYSRKNKKANLALGIIALILTTYYLVMWILTLCGVDTNWVKMMGN